MNSTTSVGLDELSSRVLAMVELSIPIASIINNNIKQNIFP